MPGSTGARPPRDEVLEREAKAILLRTAGATYEEIARTEHNGRRMFANRQNARAAVLRALERRHYEGVDNYRELQRARYERMIRATYSAAIAGDWEAFTHLRLVMQDLNRLLGLNMPTRLEVTDEMDREIQTLAAAFQELDGTWDITGIPEGSPPSDIMVGEEREEG
jgi:hypothetical protein